MNKKLRLPPFLTIAFWILTVLIPLVLILTECTQVEDTSRGIAFKVTFMMLLSILVLYSVCRKFIIEDYLEKIRAQIATVEMNYVTGVGDAEKNMTLWRNLQIKKALFSLLEIALLGGLVYLTLTGVANQLLAIRGAVMMILLCYISAYILKFAVLLGTYKKKSNTEPLGGMIDEIE